MSSLRALILAGVTLCFSVVTIIEIVTLLGLELNLMGGHLVVRTLLLGQSLIFTLIKRRQKLAGHAAAHLIVILALMFVSVLNMTSKCSLASLDSLSTNSHHIADLSTTSCIRASF